MPDERDAASPIGLGLSGTWIDLEAPTAANAADFEEMEWRQSLHPAVGPSTRRSGTIAEPMIVRERRTGAAVGMVKNHALPGGVAVFVIYLDPDLSRKGYGLEVVFMYLSHLFDSGARLVMAEILDFNRDMQEIVRKVGIEPQARLREHVYAAGEFRDMIIYSFGSAQWRGIVDRYRRMLPGGDRGPAALGRKRSEPRP